MLEVKFSAAQNPATARKTGQPVWDYLFGHISPRVMNRLGLPQVKKRTLTRAQKAIEKSIHAILIPAMQENLRKGKQVFTSALHNSWFTKPVGEGSVSLMSDVDYASNIERGSAPRTVSAEEMKRLESWASFKFRNQDPEKIAKLVARAIQKGGNRPHPFIQPALESVESLLLNNIEVEILHE